MTRQSVERVVAKTGKTPADALAVMLATGGQARLLTADEVAGAVLKLCAAGAHDTNGEAVTL